MKIAVVGSGYVGLVSGVCLAEMGNNVVMLDSDSTKIDALNNGIVPIYEPGLSELVLKNKEAGNITFSTDKILAYNQDIIFIAVGTPARDDGKADLSFVKSVAKDIASHISGYKVIVNKSTMPVGSAKMVAKIIEENLRDRNATFDIISNPEFLKEGVAIKDFMSPDRIILGGKSKRALDLMKALYAPFVLKNDRIILMSNESAEMSKYAANAMLATKISFINEMALLCESNGANINDVRIGIGSDSRIGYSFIYPGCGFGGSCFPKDISALREQAREYDITPNMLNATMRVNEYQKTLLANKVLKRFGDVSNKTFCIWGLAFKPETDDIREASSIDVIKILLNNGARINAYDPKAMDNMKRLFPNINYTLNKYDALKDADALILLTEWKEFRNPDFSLVQNQLKQYIIFDGRNIYKDMPLDKAEYYYIGGANTDFTNIAGRGGQQES